MSNLSFRRYVDITSGAIGQGGTVARELIGRIFTSNARMDTDEVLEYGNARDVGLRFGFESEEYRRAVFYFGWVSPRLTRPRRISFARYVPQAIPPRIFGGDPQSLEVIKNLGADASITVTIGNKAFNAQGIDLTAEAITTYADVATTIQTALRASDADDPMITNATVTFDPALNAFLFEGVVDGNVDISVTTGALAQAISWELQQGALWLAGHEQLTPVASVELADGISNNYASVLFLDQLSPQQHADIASALNAIGDVSYMYCVGGTADEWVELKNALQAIAGVAMHFKAGADDYIDMVPMIQTAATVYSNANATSSYMYREFDLVPGVTDNTLADQLDAARVNYYGRTQNAGRTFSFYQKAYLMGPNTAPLNQSVYANEIWLKEEARVSFMDLLRALPELPANETGRTYGMSALQEICDDGVENGVISIGREFDDLQKSSITETTGDPDAWRQIQNIGYWTDVRISEKTNSAGIREYTIDYLLVYATKEVIRTVTGRHALV